MNTMQSRTLKLPKNYIKDNDIDCNIIERNNFNFIVSKTLEESIDLYLKINKDSEIAKFAVYIMNARCNQENISYFLVYKEIKELIPESSVVKIEIKDSVAKIFLDRYDDTIKLLENNSKNFNFFTIKNNDKNDYNNVKIISKTNRENNIKSCYEADI